MLLLHLAERHTDNGKIRHLTVGRNQLPLDVLKQFRVISFKRKPCGIFAHERNITPKLFLCQ